VVVTFAGYSGHPPIPRHCVSHRATWSLRTDTRPADWTAARPDDELAESCGATRRIGVDNARPRV
jgi:hypothetical protein